MDFDLEAERRYLAERLERAADAVCRRLSPSP
jgi:hypothetical protein